MKANEFFKKHGWDDTKVMIESPFGLGEYEYLWDDLKRLVESHELVESYGGLDGSKRFIERDQEAEIDDYVTEKIKKAIAYVESCL